jgi:hypothetical protein
MIYHISFKEVHRTRTIVDQHWCNGIYGITDATMGMNDVTSTFGAICVIVSFESLPPLVLIVLIAPLPPIAPFCHWC